MFVYTFNNYKILFSLKYADYLLFKLIFMNGVTSRGDSSELSLPRQIQFNADAGIGDFFFTRDPKIFVLSFNRCASTMTLGVFKLLVTCLK